MPQQRRSFRPAIGLAIAALVLGSGLAVGERIGRAPSSTVKPSANSALGMPSNLFWARFLHRDADADHPLSAPVGDVTYEGNTDTRFLRLTREAARLPEVGHSWRNVGPYKGIKDIPGTGSGAELLGSVGGIGTAMAVDPKDKTGNTVYLGTIGGLYKSTNGGRTVHNVTEHKIPREAIGAVAVDPRHPSTVYIGTGVSIFTLSDDAAGTGVYVSHNGGRTWHRPARNTHGYGVNAIAVNPKNGTVFVGTTYGLWRSTDHGASFRKVRLATHSKHPLGNWVASVAINPYKPREVIADVGYAYGKRKYDGHVVLAHRNGLYRSENNGRTFEYMASNGQLKQPNSSNDPLGRASIAFSSAPGGKNIIWVLIEDAGKASGDHQQLDNPVLPVDVDGNTELNGLYRSGDDGKTWQLQASAQTLTTALGSATSAATYPLNYSAGVQASYNNWVLADKRDPRRVYVGLEEAFTGEYHAPAKVGVPLATTFTAIEKYANLCGFVTYYNTIPNSNGVSCPAAIPEYGKGSTHPDQHSAAIALTPSGERFYSGNDGGWWAQNTHTVTDATAVAYPGFTNTSWRSLNQPATVLPWDVTRLQDGSYLLALQDNGVGHVTPNGRAYQVCGGDGVFVFPGPNAHSYYCGIDGQRILGTTDDMKHTIDVTPFDNAMGTTFLSPWGVDRGNPNHLIAAAGNIDQTTHGMKTNNYDPTDEELLSSTWQTVFTPKASKRGPWDSSAVFTHGRVSYVGMCDTCRVSFALPTVSTPRVVTPKIATNVKPHCKAGLASPKCWHMAASKGLPHEQISGIAVDPHDPRTIYVSLRNMIVIGQNPKTTGSQKVMVSHDAGRTFHNITGNLPIADAHRIVLRAGRLYVATDVGVFTSKAGSGKWARLGRFLPEVTYRSMQISLNGRYLVAGAYGRGAWVYDFRHIARVL